MTQRIKFDVDADIRRGVTVYVLRRDVPADEPGWFATAAEAAAAAARKMHAFADEVKRQASDLGRERIRD